VILTYNHERKTGLADGIAVTPLQNPPHDGGLKVIAESGWFAGHPSGTEDLYKIYAETFRRADHLRRILEEAQAIVSNTLKAPSDLPQEPGNEAAES
jgi:phosphoglucomutase